MEGRRLIHISRFAVIHAGGGTRTLTGLTPLRILSPMRLPIPPLQRLCKILPGERYLNVEGHAENDPDGIRTRVAALKGPCPRPLDDGAVGPDQQ